MRQLPILLQLLNTTAAGTYTGSKRLGSPPPDGNPRQKQQQQQNNKKLALSNWCATVPLPSVWTNQIEALFAVSALWV